jgi:hypothetical protein
MAPSLGWSGTPKRLSCFSSAPSAKSRKPPTHGRLARPLLAVGAHLELIVGEGSELLRHDHAPSVEYELAELLLVDGLQANDQFDRHPQGVGTLAQAWARGTPRPGPDVTRAVCSSQPLRSIAWEPSVPKGVKAKRPLNRERQEQRL